MKKEEQDRLQKKFGIKFKTAPFKHQETALEKSWYKEKYAYFMEMGCVDGETEFLSHKGWKKIKDWNQKDKVGQAAFNEKTNNWEITHVNPDAYIEADYEGKWYQLRENGIFFTEEHEMIFAEPSDGKIEWQKQNIAEFYERLQDDETLLLPTGFTVKRDTRGKNCGLSNEFDARLLLLSHIYGEISFRNAKFTIFFERDSKQLERALYLLNRSTMPYEHKVEGNVEVITYLPQLDAFDFKTFYNLSEDYVFAILDEFLKWHNCTGEFVEGNRKQIDVYDKDTASLLNYWFALYGIDTEIQEGNRTDRNGKIRRTCFLNIWGNIILDKKRKTDKNICSFSTVFKNDIRIIVSESQKKYCFRVPSGNLILRKNNKTIITGNSGKTKTIIDNIAILAKKGHIDSVLVLAPKGVYANWSNKEIPQHMSDDIAYRQRLWASTASKTYQRSTDDFVTYAKEGMLDIFVVNIEAINFDNCLKRVAKFLEKRKSTYVILDESTCIKNHEAKRTKKALAIANKCTYRRIATGSPVTNSPMDIYSQASFLSKEVLGYGSFYAFRGDFANLKRIPVGGGRDVTVIESYKNLDKLNEKIDQFAYRVLKKDCLDLPDKIYQSRAIELTDVQKQIYVDLLKDALATHNGAEMTTQMALDLSLRLHQIICGCFKGNDGVSSRLKNNRITALEEILDEAQGKSIIFANYIVNIAEITEMIEKKYGEDSYVHYYGATKDQQRADAIRRFQDPEDSVKFFIGNTQTAGKGITLTEAQNVIYYSNDYSLENRLQSEDRAHRPGQKNNVTYHDIVAFNTIDEKIFKALKDKKNVADTIMKSEGVQWLNL